MKYCLNYKQNKIYLSQCEEIKLPYQAGEDIIDLMDINPKAEFIVVIPRDKDENFDWDKIKRWDTMTQGKITCCLSSLRDAVDCARRDLKFYMGYPVDSFYDLQGLARLGVSYICIGPELFFNMPKVAAFGIPVRLTPNLAHYNFIPMVDGVCGQWVRPEDQALYAQYGVSTIEFENCSLQDEERLYKIYGIHRRWTGELQDIISNLNYSGKSTGIPITTIQKRLDCNHQCQKGRGCRLCYKALGN